MQQCRLCRDCLYSECCIALSPHASSCPYFFSIGEEYDDSRVEDLIERKRQEFSEDWAEYANEYSD